MARRKTIGTSPLDAVIPAAPEASTAEVERRREKLRYTFHLPAELVERVRDAVYWQPDLTLAKFAEWALKDELKKLERERNEGRPFPARTGELKGGRPISVG